MDIRKEYGVREEIVEGELHWAPRSPLAVVELDTRREELERLDKPIFTGDPQWEAIARKAGRLRGRADLSRGVAAVQEEFS